MPEDGGVAIVETQRAKYKHWYAVGSHLESDKAFKRALADGSVEWFPRIIDPMKLF